MEAAFIWGGGLAFVASLALTAWTYAFSFGLPREWVGIHSIAWDSALLILFAGHHSLFAREAVKAAMSQLIPEHRLRTTYVWIASGLLAAVCLGWAPVGGELYHLTFPTSLVAVAVQIAGLWITVRAARTIDPLELAGIRAAGSAGHVVDRGLYGAVRHPLYLGWMLMVFGTPHMTGDRLTFAIVTTLYLFAAIPFEERSLRRTFGTDYVAYAGRVRWRVIPYLY